MEMILTEAFKLNPIKINSLFEINFDAEREEQFYEIKSLHRSSKLPLYDWRVAKEQSAQVKVFYLIGLHRVRGALSEVEVWEKMEDTLSEIVLLPAREIHNLARGLELKQNRASTNPEVGYQREGYKDGYRNVSAKSIRAKAPDFIFQADVELSGFHFTPKVFGSIL